MQIDRGEQSRMRRDGRGMGERHPRKRRRTRLALAALISSITILAACNVSAVLTPDGTDSYQYQYAPDGTTVTVSAAAGNTGGDLRELFWDNQPPVATNSQSCATWQSDSGWDDQEGIALHITDVNHVIRAVTVTKNVWGFAGWNFNFHVWDTSQTTPFSQFGSVNFAEALSVNGAVQPYPWHVCAQIIGSTLETKVWLDGESEPAWDDPVHSASITVPAGWLNAGSAGWYIGHLHPSESATFTGLSTTDLDTAIGLVLSMEPSAPHNAFPLFSTRAP